MWELLQNPVSFRDHPIETIVFAITLAFWCRFLFDRTYTATRRFVWGPEE